MTRGSWLSLTYIAQATGSAVMSEPVTSWPWYFVHAVQRGLQIASWMENLPSEEQPPPEIWHHNERLTEWFDRIKAERKQKYSSNSNEEWESVPGTETVEFDIADEIKELRGF